MAQVSEFLRKKADASAAKITEQQGEDAVEEPKKNSTGGKNLASNRTNMMI